MLLNNTHEEAYIILATLKYMNKPDWEQFSMLPFYAQIYWKDLIKDSERYLFKSVTQIMQ